MRYAVGCGRAGLCAIRPFIERIVAVRGGVPQRIDGLINLARVIPLGVAGDKAVGGIEPAADRGLVAADARRRDGIVLRTDGWIGSSEIDWFVVRVVGLGHATGRAARCIDRTS